MALDPNSFVGQLQTIYLGLSGYYTSLKEYLSNPESVTPPVESDLLNSMDYSDLYTYSSLQSASTATVSSGAVVDAIYVSSSVSRDIGLASKRKSDYYEESIAESGSQATFYDFLNKSSISEIYGVSTPGGIN